MPTIKSGAFVQQCFASHPQSLSFKAFALPDRVVVTCTSCDLRHRFLVRTLTTRAGAEGSPEREAKDDLAQCVAAHPTDVRVTAVDVVHDSVKLRCGACSRTYKLTVSAFETYRRDA
jgi:transcription elongation factor Elf1